MCTLKGILLLYREKGGTFMATARNRSHKHFQLDSVKIKRAQKALRAKTETEAIERALDLAIAEHESNRLVLEATERFVKSGIDITALRRGDDAALALRRFTTDAPLWLSAVVLEELYAGAADRDRQVVERLERDFDRAKRILVPNLSDWTQAGRVLARLAAKYHYEQIGQGRLTNDALIAMSAGRVGIRVITANERDFSRLAEFRPFQWQVTVL